MTQTDPPCLLAYTFYPTQPQPVQISTPNGGAKALINVSVSNPKKAYCNKIELYIPVGSDPDALTPDDPVLAPSTTKWSGGKSQVRGDETELKLAGTFARYTFHCNSKDEYGVNYPLAFSISVDPVSPAAGDYTVWVSEYSDQADDPSKFIRRSSPFTLQKAQPQFYLRNFIAGTPSTDKDQGVPRGEFQKGEPIELSWEGNGSLYTLYTAGNAKPLDAGPATSVTLKDGLADTTTYILQAQVTGSDGGGGSSFETVFLYQSLTIKILKPVIQASSVETSSVQTTTLTTSSLTVTDDKADATLRGGLSVAKGARFQDTLKVDKTSTLTGAVTVEDALTITSQKGGPLRVTGPIDNAGSGIEFRHSNGSQGIGFTFNTIYATGNNADQDLVLAPRGGGRVIVKGAQQLVGSRRLWSGRVGYGAGWADLGVQSYGLGGPRVQAGAKRQYRLFMISWDQWNAGGSLVRIQYVEGGTQEIYLPAVWGNASYRSYRGQPYSGFFEQAANLNWIKQISINSNSGKETPDAEIYELWLESWDFFG